MKLLLDANLSPTLVEPLTDAGYEVVHVIDLGLATASDDIIFEYAVAEGWVVVTADSDFPMMLALRRAMTPSVVLLRHVTDLAPSAQSALLKANLPSVTPELEAGAVVSLSPTRLAVRDLPIT